MKKYLCFLFLLMLCSVAHAATPSTEGTEFWLTFMNNQNIPASSDSLQLKLIVSSRESATVTMRNPQTGWSASLLVGANQVAEYVLPTSEVYTYSAGQLEKTGVVVTSTAPVSLYAANFKEHTYDATIVMPTTALGADYVVQMYEADMSSKEISVVATADNTQVTITPHARTTSGQVKGVPFTITLQRGESYMLMSNDRGNDFSGTRIQADKPVAVFAGHSCLYVPVDNPTCDHIVEQQLPTQMWGKQFAVTKTKEHNGDRVMITARNNNTKVYVNGNLQTTLNELESYEFRLIDNSAYIETTEPTACYLYVEGAKDNNMVGDPSSVHISPIEQKIKRLTFATFQTDVSRTHYVNVVTTEAGARAMKLDGVSIADQFSPVEGNSALRFAQIHIQHGIHTLETNNDGFTGYVYGVGWCESYAYTIGSAIVPLDGQIVVDGESRSDVEYNETRCYKKSIRFEPHANVEFNTIEWSFGDGTTSTQKVVNHTYTAPGKYRIRMIITNEDGRDTAYTNLTLIEQLCDTLYADICKGDVYKFANRAYSTTGKYDVKFTSSGGCDSIVTLCLTVHDTYLVTTNATFPIGSSYRWRGKWYREEGTYYDTLITVAGCDSILELKLTKTDPTEIMYDTICWQPTYEFKGHTFNIPSYQGFENVDYIDYVLEYRDKDACISYKMNLAIAPMVDGNEIVVYDTIQKGSVYEWMGDKYTEKGTYYKTVYQACECAIDYTLHLEVLAFPITKHYAELCHGDAYTFQNKEYTEPGVYYDTIWTLTGVDAIYEIKIVDARKRTEFSISNVSAYTFNGKTYTESGTYVDTLQSTIGCDSIVTLNLTILPKGADCIEAVDLGLSVKWATCNVGAEYPEDYGDYFAWGEVTPKEKYDWTTYLHCKGTNRTMTKYCSKSSYGYNGFTDNKTVLDPEDDAAIVNWGGAWRMPIDAEFTELREQCKWTWTTQNGVKGYKVVGPNGNSIFLPAAGYMNGTSLNLVGSYGYFWSSSFNTSGPYYAYSVYFSSGVNRISRSRNFGQSVRPVCSKEQELIKTYQFVDKDTICGNELPYIWRGKECDAAGVYYDSLKTALGGDSIYVLELMVLPENECGESSDCECVLVCEGAVDLGLSVDWAPFNIGATKPEELGYYLAWGETAPQQQNYSWKSYKYCAGTNTTMTKYCTNGSYGTVDNKTILDPEDDAAIANLGGSWRMPTKEEYAELIAQCTWTWTTINGVNGCKVTGKNGNSIFLPAAGCMNSGGPYDVGSSGYYYSSTLRSDQPYNAYDVDVTSSGGRMGVGTRNYGQSMRAVCSKNSENRAIIDNVTICYGEKYNWNGVEYLIAGEYLDTLKSVHGCDSIVMLKLTILPEIEPIVSNATICEGENYMWNGKEYSIAGEYIDTLQSTQGCDSIVILNLTIKSICECLSGCDGAVDLGLSVKWATRNVGAEYPEDYGDYFAWGEIEPKQKYSWETYKYSKGSSSTLTKYCSDNGNNGFIDNKTVLESEDDAATMNWGASWRMPTDAEMTELRTRCTWIWTTQGGVNGYKVVGPNGNFIFLPAAGVFIEDNLDYVKLDGNYWSSSLSLFSSTSSPHANCFTFNYDNVTRYGDPRCVGKSIRPVCSKISESEDVIYNIIICYGENYKWNGKEYSTSGVYKDTLQTDKGCDSIVTLNLTVLPEVVGTEESVTICYGESYKWNSKECSKSGVYVDTLQSAQGCDSIVTLILKVLPEVVGKEESATICYGESYKWNSKEYSKSGVYIDTLQSAQGCDSVVILNLMVLDNYYFVESATIKVGKTYHWHEKTLRVEGVYYDSLLTVGGCDSIYTLTLTVEDDYAPMVIDCDLAVDLGLSVKWAPFNIGATTPEDYGDYFAWGETKPKGSYDWDTYKFGNIVNLTKYNNVDGLTTLALEDDAATVNWGGSWRMPTIEEMAELFDNCTWTWTTQNGKNGYRVTGRNGKSIFLPIAGFMSGNDCVGEGENAGYWMNELASSGDISSGASITLNKINKIKNVSFYRYRGYSIRPVCVESYVVEDTVTVCYGESYMWNGKEYSMSGVYTDTLQNIQGGDSIVTLILKVLPEVVGTEESATICYGESYRWQGVDYSVSGVYSDTLQSAQGCDSIVTLNLTVLPSYIFADTITIQEGDSYSWRGDTYEEAGVYSDSLLTIDGCDSVYTLTLIVEEAVVEDVVVDEIKIEEQCAGTGVMDVEVTLTSGVVDEVSFEFSQVGKDAGLENTTLQYSTQMQVQYADVRAGKYKLKLIGLCNGTKVFEEEKDLTFLYPSTVLMQKWNDVVAVLTHDYNGGYNFVDFKWYKNGVVLSGETRSYIHQPLEIGAEYSALLTEDNGMQLMTCPLIAINNVDISLYPTLLNSGQRVKCNVSEFAVIYIYDMMGNLVSECNVQSGETEIEMPYAAGVYMAKIVAGNNNESNIKLIVR